MEFLRELGILGTGLTIAAGFIGLFWKADGALSRSAKESLTKLLLGVRVPTAFSWPQIFASMFDRIFGARHFSIRCILATAVASVFWVLVLTVVWALLRPGEFERWSHYGWLTALGLGIWIQGMGANVLPDYLSLLETRWIIERMKRAATPQSIMLWLIVDLLASGTIFFIAYFLWVLISVPLGIFPISEVLPAILDSPRILTDKLLPLHADPQYMFGLGAAPGIFFYSTFFTSFWVWLYAISQMAVRFAGRSQPGLKFLQWVLPIKEYPMRSLGLVAGGLSCLIYWPIALLFGDPLAESVKTVLR